MRGYFFTLFKRQLQRGMVYLMALTGNSGGKPGSGIKVSTWWPMPGMVLLGIDYQYCKGCLRCTHICKFGALVPAKEAEQDMDAITVKLKALK